MSSAGIEISNLDNITEYYNKPYPFDFYPEQFKTDMVKNLLQAIDIDEESCFEGFILDIEGKELWLESTIVPVKGKQDKTDSLIVISINITERKQLEQKLRKNYTLFSQAEQMGKIGYWEWDVLTDRLIACSKQYAAIFESTMEELLDLSTKDGQVLDSQTAFDQDVVSSLHEDDQKRYVEVTDAAYENKEPWEIEFRYITSTQQILHLRELGEPILNQQGELIRTYGTIQDITDRKETEQRLKYQANHDALTGLINRRVFEERVAALLSTVEKDKAKHALCFMDLDQFKIVNDTCGHIAGDELLIQISSVLTKIIRNHDTLARLGGDEFGLLLEHCSLSNANRVITSILNAINDYQFLWEGHVFRVGISIGLTLITEESNNITELLRDADAACYVAKDMGRNRLHVHSPEDAEIAKHKGEMQWVSRLNHAFENDKFCLYAQSIVPLDGSNSRHYELLIRMLDNKGDIIPPNAFLPAAERYNLITKLDKWVIINAFETLKNNPEFVDEINFISINLSGTSLTNTTFLKFVISQLNKHSVAPNKICFEITETAAISNLNKAIKFITTLKDFGCKFALDDFGSGLSSFAYLKNLPVDYVKIDGMFVKDIVDDPIDHAMVKSINEIGQLMGKQTIAEFVENDEIMAELKKIGVNYAQGYGIGKPMPFNELV